MKMASEVRKIYGFPGKYKSMVWENFGFYMDDNGTLDRSKAICRICRRAISYSGNTTNLHNHVSHHHRQPQVPGGSRMSPLMKYTVASSEIVRYETDPSSNDGDKSSSNTACPLLLQIPIMEFLISNLEPAQVVDTPTFRNLLRTCGSKHDIPNSDFFSSVLLETYVDTRQKVMNIISAAKSMYLKLNIWQTNNCRTNMLTVYVQVLHADLKVEAYTVQTVELPDPYTFADISNCLGNIITEWNIPESTVILSSDVMEITEAAKQQNSLKINCLIDTIGSAVNACLSKTIIANLVSHTRNLFLWCMANPTAMNMFQEKQVLLSLPTTKLKLDSSSNWISTYEMLDMFQEQTAAFCAVKKDPLFLHNEFELLSASEQTLLQNLLVILKSFVMAFNMVTEMTHVSAAVILPILKKLKTTLKIAEVDSQVIVDIKNSLWTKLCEQYAADNVHCFLLLCSVLDPRYKDLKFVDPEDRENALSLLKKEMRVIAETKQTSAADDKSPEKDILIKYPEILIKVEPLDEELDFVLKSDMHGYDEEVSPAKKPKKEQPDYVDWLDDVVHDEVSKEKGNCDAVTFEISRYESEKQILSHASPLSWWTERQFIYPLLFEVAKKYLSAPAILKATDIKQGDILERKQQAIAPDFVEYLMFLNGNYFKVKN